MTTYEPGDVVLLAFPFTDGIRQKQRPALVLLNTGDPDIVLARITSQLYTTAFDVALSDQAEAGLLLPSVVRLHKLATLEKGTVSRYLGHLSAQDWAKVRSVLNALWSLSP
ncbi:type II toxin-antitoxin system PemK/MazF family toxin [Nodosilinea sp. LEGE 06152]|uniref:type II toxin-antitoxin system PemK/MazF family toxin n=1 Tax=Nodosilinea sp. LEGE 06152 TaxID=2777966 RepID=UPI00187ED621|nr:type II toxin-antitoxin system PemK/MazF family toxin [Nodosilinea sp. LEGE 06152]MBE9158428.1 type II toxin-antitoxin system PemK/MazF family toxin [Nodosilinea sp. LEGE 06152]